MTEADEWARAEAAPPEEEIRRARRPIGRVTEDVDQFTDAERAEIRKATQVVRKTRQGFLGLPLVRRIQPATPITCARAKGRPRLQDGRRDLADAGERAAA